MLLVSLSPGQERPTVCTHQRVLPLGGLGFSDEGQLCAQCALDISAQLGGGLFQSVGCAGWGEAWAQPSLATRLWGLQGWPGFVIRLADQESSSHFCLSLFGDDRWSDPGIGRLCWDLLLVMLVKQGEE